MSYLAMGQVLWQHMRPSSTHIVIGVEIGYLVRCFKFIVDATDPNIDAVDELKVGDKVMFNGELRGHESLDNLQFDSISKIDFESCQKCGIALISDTCPMLHDEEAKKLKGIWNVLHTTRIGRITKVLFEKDNTVLGFDSCSKLWYHRTVKELQAGDEVKLQGWKYKGSTTLKYVIKLN